MRGVFGSRHVQRRPMINITSLIDVMFLLVIFLTVSTTFREQLGIEIDLPEAKTSETHEKTTPEEIVVTKNGEIYFGGRLVDGSTLRDELIKFAQTKPDTPIMLRADERAVFGVVVRVLDIAREIGGLKLIIPTEEPAEKAENPQ